MLICELRDTLQKLIKRKITNEYLGSLLGTSSQNISKRINNDSQVTIEELETIQQALGIEVYTRVDNFDRKIINNSLETQNDTTVLSKAENFGRRLTELQDKHEFYDKEMAKLLRISEDEYIDLKLCDAEPDYNVLIRLKQRFKVSIDWLLFGD